MLSILGFADDTNILGRKFDASRVEEITVQILLEVGEEAHPGKTERKVAGVRHDELREGFCAAVRFLGPWIDMNGGCVTDTAMRLERARGAKSKSNCLCSELVCGRKRELFRRPSLRHCCSEQKYVRFQDRY